MSTFLCLLEDLEDGNSRGFDPHGAGRDTVFIVRRGARVSAWRDACPHVDGAPLAWRKDAYLNADRSAIVCYGHGAMFDIETGACLQGPCLGQSLTRAAVDVAPDGSLQLADCSGHAPAAVLHPTCLHSRHPQGAL
jgi:nitrite reductase/ring-hydroxylating ferredoxin subunit